MTQEQLDIGRVREWCDSAHVDDPDALQAFHDGRGIFDVEAHGARMRGFLERHPELKADVKLDEFGCHPGRNGLIDHRPIYFAFEKK